MQTILSVILLFVALAFLSKKWWKPLLKKHAVSTAGKNGDCGLDCKCGN